MRMGIGVLLLALGAILTFAVDWKFEGLDLHIVGWILMVVGTGWLILHFHFRNRNRKGQAVYDGRQPHARTSRTHDNSSH